MKKLLFIAGFLLTQITMSQITDTGDEVGIGTSNPDAKLEVRGNTTIGGSWNPSQSIFNISDGANNLIMDTNEIYSSGSLYLGSKAANIAVFRSITDAGNSDRVTIKSNGYVGIGTTNPISPIQIVNDFDAILTFQTSDNHWLYTNWRDNSGTRRAWVGLDNSLTGFNINVENGTNRIILSGGNVGIGTTNPGSWKLAVNGNIRAKEIKVETGWSDFVFENDYNLPTLEEVEQHINEKGHLKDIPSAEEVAENGIFLGEMDAKLLQKIEELTLYTIEQDKEIKKQKEKNKEMEERLAKLEQMMDVR